MILKESFLVAFIYLVIFCILFYILGYKSAEEQMKKFLIYVGRFYVVLSIIFIIFYVL